MNKKYEKYIVSGAKLSALEFSEERKCLPLKERFTKSISLVNKIEDIELKNSWKHSHIFSEIKKINFSEEKNQHYSIFDHLGFLENRRFRTLKEKHPKLDYSPENGKFIGSILTDIRRGQAGDLLWIFLAYLCEKHSTEAKNFYKNIGLDYPSDKKKKKAEDYEEPQGEWLDPYNSTSIPFIGRDREIKALDDFTNHKDEFKIWAMVAPSGAGKTRLCHEWSRRLPEDKRWEILYLGRDKYNKLTFRRPDHSYKTEKKVSIRGDNWEDWSPKQSTIFVIDYVFGFDDVIHGLIKRCYRPEYKLDHDVRLLVIDHVFPTDIENLKKDPRWNSVAAGRGGTTILRELFFNEAKPLEITETEDQQIILSEVIRNVVMRPAKGEENENFLRTVIEPETLKEALEYLEATPGAKQPLFAALVGDAIREMKNFKDWDRRELIKHYLSENKRLPWADTSLQGEEGMWASCIIAAATILGEIKLKSLYAWDREWGFEKTLTAPKNYAPILPICERVLSKPFEQKITKFFPDILGETFFLLLLEQLPLRKGFYAAFRHILACGTEEESINHALECVAFLTRTIRNLSNDDPTLAQTKTFWILLTDFINPKFFKERSLIRWAMSVALTEGARVFENSIDLFNGDEYNSEINLYVESGELLGSWTIIANVSVDDLLMDVPQQLINLSMENVFYYCNFLVRGEKLHEVTLRKLINYSILMDERHPKNPSFCYVAGYGWTNLIGKFCEAGVKVNLFNTKGLTGLMIACVNFRSRFIIEFCRHSHNVDIQSNDKNKVTALMLASEFCTVEAVTALLNTNPNLNLQDKEGDTAISYAALAGQEDVLELLVNYSFDPNLPNKYFGTPFMYVCQLGTANMVRKLVQNGAHVNHEDSDFRTPLIIATMCNSIEVIDKLIQQGANLDVQDIMGNTALTSAILRKRNKKVIHLIDKGADIDLPNYDPASPLILACENGMVTVVEELIEKRVDVNFQTTEGRTALHVAVCGKENYIAKLLLDAGADPSIKWRIKQEEFIPLDLVRNTWGPDLEGLIVEDMLIESIQKQS